MGKHLTQLVLILATRNEGCSRLGNVTLLSQMLLRKALPEVAESSCGGLFLTPPFLLGVQSGLPATITHPLFYTNDRRSGLPLKRLWN